MGKIKKVDELVPGDILADDILDSKERLLMAKGIELSLYHIKKIKEFGITKVVVVGNQETVEISEETKNEWKKNIDERIIDKISDEKIKKILYDDLLIYYIKIKSENI